MRNTFIPHEKNEYKPHFLRKGSVAFLSFFIVFSFFVAVYRDVVLVKTDFLSAVISRTLVDLTNANRVQSAVQPLTVNPLLEEAARMKAEHMAAYGYFAHVSPDGVTPWHWFDKAGYRYIYAGENLAVNFTESVDVDRAWMNSPTHRDNIVNNKFTEIGIATARGYYNGRETVFVVQMFGRPLPQIRIPDRVVVPAVVTMPPRAVQGTTTPDSEPTPPPPTSSLVEEAGLQEEEPVVITETDTFIAVENPQFVEEDTQEEVPYIEESSLLDRGLANSGQMLAWFYLLLAIVILGALLATVFIQVRKQHPLQAFFAVILIAIIVILLFIYSEKLLPSVLIT